MEKIKKIYVFALMAMLLTQPLAQAQSNSPLEKMFQGVIDTLADRPSKRSGEGIERKPRVEPTLSDEEAADIKQKIHEYVQEFLDRGATAANGCYEALRRYGTIQRGYSYIHLDYSEAQCESDMREAESQAKMRREQEQLKAAQAREAEVNKMRSGSKPISTFEDAVEVHSALNGISLAGAPKIRPDGKVYYLSGTIEKADDKAASFTALVNNGAANYVMEKMTGRGQSEPKYFYVRLPKSMEEKYYDMAKIGIGFDIVGKYASNLNYKTISGETKSMPVFDVQYLEFWTSKKLK